MPDIDRRTLLTLVVAIVCIAGAAIVAASLPHAVLVESDDEWTPPGTDNDQNLNSSDSVDEVDIVDNDRDPNALALDTCVRPLTEWYGIAAFAAGFLGVLGAIRTLWNTSVAVMSSYILAPFALIAYFMVTNCPEAGGGGVAQAGSNNSSVVSQLGGSQVFAPPEISPLWLVGVFMVAILGAGAVLYSSSRDQVVEEFGDVEEDEPDVADLAAAAGRAADRLEKHDADVDNEVYRAWYEMTQLLNVPDEETATAGEFAAAAIEVGLGEAHVDELTTLFEEVRYGTAEADERREQRAIDVFRRIEEAYADPTEGGT